MVIGNCDFYLLAMHYNIGLSSQLMDGDFSIPNVVFFAFLISLVFKFLDDVNQAWHTLYYILI